MESPDLYPPVLGAAGIEVLVPDPAERAAIQRHTFDELVREVVTDRARDTFRVAAASLVGRGADVVVLACTEHGLVLRDGDLTVPVLDSAREHARALAGACLS